MVVVLGDLLLRYSEGKDVVEGLHVERLFYFGERAEQEVTVDLRKQHSVGDKGAQLHHPPSMRNPLETNSDVQSQAEMSQA